jgi:hypothetical protein
LQRIFKHIQPSIVNSLVKNNRAYINRVWREKQSKIAIVKQ